MVLGVQILTHKFVRFCTRFEGHLTNMGEDYAVVVKSFLAHIFNIGFVLIITVRFAGFPGIPGNTSNLPARGVACLTDGLAEASFPRLAAAPHG